MPVIWRPDPLELPARQNADRAHRYSSSAGLPDLIESRPHRRC
jgi:hypothetical protein